MNKLFKFFPFVILIFLFFIFYFFLSHNSITLFNPKGAIAFQESQLIVTFISLMLIVAIPAVALTFFVAWKFRASNSKAKYNPNGETNKILEIIFWIVPAVIVLILATLTWKMTHALDPFKPIQSSTKPLTIQVVALRWKWLFIYPEQGIATVNYIQFPVNTPVNFQLTADAPMNSFWIPQLGGQMYAMPGMVNNLHLLANNIGTYNGSAAEISGKGFAGMRFDAKASTKENFEAWVQNVKQSKSILNHNTYTILSQPSEENPATFYSSVDKDLYNLIIMGYMEPGLTK